MTDKPAEIWSAFSDEFSKNFATPDAHYHHSSCESSNDGSEMTADYAKMVGETTVLD